MMMRTNDPNDPSRDLYEDELYDCIDWSTDQPGAYIDMEQDLDQLEAELDLDEDNLGFGALDELISDYDDLLEIGSYE